MNTKTQTRILTAHRPKKSRTDHLFSSALPLHVLLIDGVNQLVQIINTKSTCHVDLIHCGFEQDCLKEQDRTAVYLIVKNQLENIVKNTKATTATIHLAKNYEQVAIVIEDNGMATSLTKMKNSRSMKAVQALVKHHKGQFNISEQNGGMIVEVLILVG